MRKAFPAIVLLGIVFAVCGICGLGIFLIKKQDVPNTVEISDAGNPLAARFTRPRAQNEVEGNQTLRKPSQDGTVDYGYGVRYFPYTEAEFANSLASFLKWNANLEVTAMSPNVVRTSRGQSWNTDYGVAVGYFVTFRERQ